MSNIKALSESEIIKNLETLPGWKYQDNKIIKEFTLSSFLKVIELIDKLAPFCEKIDHHPDIHISYKDVRFELQRFDIGGKVTEKDFDVAKKIEALYSEIN